MPGSDVWVFLYLLYTMEGRRAFLPVYCPLILTCISVFHFRRLASFRRGTVRLICDGTLAMTLIVIERFLPGRISLSLSVTMGDDGGETTSQCFTTSLKKARNGRNRASYHRPSKKLRCEPLKTPKSESRRLGITTMSFLGIR